MKTISTIQNVMETVCRTKSIRRLFFAGWLLLGFLSVAHAQTGDYGDAPASYEQGNPARHTSAPGYLAINTNPDVESGPNSVAPGASCNAGAGDGTDEDGFWRAGLIGGTTNLPDINISRTTYRVYIPADRNHPSPASVCGWIDFNRNGIFDANERACASVFPEGYYASFDTPTGLWQLEWTIPAGIQKGVTYARFRIAFDSETGGNMQPIGAYTYGEVEDYSLNIVDLTDNITCGTGFSLKPVDIISQREIDSYSTCPAFSSNNTIENATGWHDPAHPYGGQMLVMDKPGGCFSHLPGLAYWSNQDAAMPAGAEGSRGWLGIHSITQNSSGEGATADLLSPLAAQKVYRGVFWATRNGGSLIGAHGGTGYLRFYGVNDTAIGTEDGSLNASNSELLYESPAITNTLVWKLYSYTFTPTKNWQYIRVEAGSATGNFSTTSTYLYFDQFTLYECQAPDRGDAPVSYGNALHTIPASGTTALYIGNTAPDGDPVSFTANTATAKGDDLDGTDDEGGPLTTICTTSGTFSTTVNVVNATSNAAAKLVAWIDFNRNGTFEASEGISVPTPTTGSYTLTWTGLTGLIAGQTYARFRLTTDASVTTSTPVSLATDGEVEDWSATIVNEGGAVTASTTSLTTCSGEQVAINYTTTPSSQQVIWRVMPGGQMGSGNVLDFPVNTTTAPISYTYTAYIPSVSGCASTSAVTVVTVNPRPTVVPSVCSLTICSGQTGNITFTPSIPGSTIHWTRTPTTPAPSSGTGNISQVLTNTGPTSVTYTYQIWAESPAPASCPSSTTITCEIVVTPGLTVLASANNPTVCTGSPLSLSAGVSQTGTYTYSWVGPNGYVASGANPQVSATATLTQSGSYTVTVTDASGCSGTATVDAVVIDCTVPCALTVTASASQTAVCAGQTINLTSTVSGNAGPATYAWSGPNGFSSTVANPTIPAASSLAAGTYTVLVTDPTTGTSCVQSQSVTISVNNLSGTASSNSPQCTGNDLQLMANIQGGSGTQTFSWTGPNGFVSTAQNPTLTNSTTAVSGSYTLVVTDTAAPNCSFTATTAVTVTNSPNLTVTSGSGLTVCSTQSTTLAVGGSNGATVTWTNNLGQSGTGTTINFGGLTNVGGTPQTVTYTITAQAGSCIDREIVTITVNPAPALQVKPTMAVICALETTNLTATAFPATATVNWTRDVANPAPGTGSAPGTVTVKDVLPAGAYNYTFTATGTNGCSSPPVVVPVTVNN